MRLQLLSLLILASCTSAPAVQSGYASRAMSGTLTTQFFIGKIQRSSLDGSQKYGPQFDSLVKRTVDREHHKIQECVFQEGKAFVTQMTPTEVPLQFNVQDNGGFSKGFLIFKDDSLAAWSYNVDVVKPFVGKVTGSLADGNGAQIKDDGKMEIKKIWNGNMLIHEIYSPATLGQYQDLLKTMAPNGAPAECL